MVDCFLLLFQGIAFWMSRFVLSLLSFSFLSLIWFVSLDVLRGVLDEEKRIEQYTDIILAVFV